MGKLITQHLSGKKILLLFVVTNMVYATMLTITIPNVMSYAGGLKLPDMLPMGYSSDYINNLLHTLGDAGRRAYLYTQLPVDMVYPLLFGITYCLLIAWLLTRLKRGAGPLYYLCYFPLLAGLFDYLENAGIIAMLYTYPGNPGALTLVASICTVIKSMATTVSMLALIVLAISLVISKVRR